MLKSEEAKTKNIEKTGLYHRVYLPEGSEDEKSPGVFIVHGRAGDASLMWVFSKVLKGMGATVISPQAKIKDPVGSYSWWLIDETPTRAKEEDIERSVEEFKGFVEKCVETYNLDENELYAFGFSQGAALLGVLSLRFPELFKGVGLLASYIPEFAFDKKGEGELPEYFMFNGTEDEVITFDRGEETKRRLEEVGASLEFHSDDVGHKVSSSGIRKLGEWFETMVRSNSGPG